jgi:hypothetical protein
LEALAVEGLLLKAKQQALVNQELALAVEPGLELETAVLEVLEL